MNNPISFTHKEPMTSSAWPYGHIKKSPSCGWLAKNSSCTKFHNTISRKIMLPDKTIGIAVINGFPNVIAWTKYHSLNSCTKCWVLIHKKKEAPLNPLITLRKFSAHCWSHGTNTTWPSSFFVELTHGTWCLKQNNRSEQSDRSDKEN